MGRTLSTAYDALGNAASVTNRRGNVIAIEHNADGQLTRKTYVDGTVDEYGYDAHGNLTSIVDPSGTTTFVYDAGDRLTRVDYPDGRFLVYKYDDSGRRTQMVDQEGFTVNYGYDALGHLKQLTDAADELIVAYTYDAVGLLARRDMGNGAFTTYAYDDADQVRQIVNHASDGSVNSQFDYTYDALRRRTAMTTLDGAWTYTYDAVGQLTHAVFASTNPDVPDQDLSYEYDAVGNRIRAIENGVTTDYTTNELNQYTQVGTATYEYDTDGNLISIVDGASTTTFTYDDEGRLVAVTADGSDTSYEYNALNQRIASTVDGARTEFLNDPTGMVNLVAEFNAGGTLVAQYTYGLGLVSRVDASGAAAFYDFDATGSTAGLTGAAGSYVNQYRYLPFGGLLTRSETIANQFQYVGQFGVAAESNGLDYMRSRYYSASDGRFLSADAIGILGGVDLYRYARNSPADRIDPTGLIVYINTAIETVQIDADLALEEIQQLMAAAQAETEAAAFDAIPDTIPEITTLVAEEGSAVGSGTGGAVGGFVLVDVLAVIASLGVGLLVGEELTRLPRPPAALPWATRFAS